MTPLGVASVARSSTPVHLSVRLDFQKTDVLVDCCALYPFLRLLLPTHQQQGLLPNQLVVRQSVPTHKLIANTSNQSRALHSDQRSGPSTTPPARHQPVKAYL